MNTKLITNKRICFLIFALVAILVATSARYSRSARATNCPDGWWNSDDPTLLTLCGQEKDIAAQKEEKELLDRLAQEPYYQSIPGSRPTVLLPQPDDTKKIQEMLDNPDPAQRQGRSAYDEGATSEWQAGSVPNADYTDWYPLGVVTYAGNGTANTVRYTNDNNPSLVTYGGEEEMAAKYEHTWVCPKAIGKLRITNIRQKDGVPGISADSSNFAGLNYVVYFTNDGVMGGTVSGNFDMTTETWAFDP